MQAKTIKAVCEAVKGVREATLAIPGHLTDSERLRIESAFDAASRDLCRELRPLNPKFDALRFLVECGVKGVK